MTKPVDKYFESKMYEINIFQNLDTEYQKKKKAEWTLPVVLTVVGTSLGIAVPSGYCMGVINSPALHMRAWCNHTLIEQYDLHLSPSGLNFLWSTVVSINLIAGAFGAFMGGRLADRFGRRGAFMLNCINLLIGGICFFFCRIISSVPLLLIGRFIIGLTAGMTTTILPMYHSEIAAITQRGTLSVGTGIGFTLGTLSSQIMSMEMVLGDAQHWNWALSAYVIFVLIALLPSKYYPESPKYLYVLKNDCDNTHLALKRLRGNVCSSVIEEEINSMQLECSVKRQTIGYSTLLSDKRFRMPLLLFIIMTVGQQLSGINAIFYYSVSIFHNAGLQADTAQWLNFGMGVINLSTGLLSPMLMGIYNRRTMLMISSTICGIFLIAFAVMENNTHLVDWFIVGCIVCLYIYIVGYQLGLGSIPVFIGTELFEVAPSSAASSLSNLIGWFSNFSIALMFPILQSLMGSWIFLIFSANCIFLFIITKYYLPETRGRKIAETAELVSHGFKRIHK